MVENEDIIECCNNCRHKFKLTQFDYSHKGCIHTVMEGFICNVFAFEGDMIWMIGSDPTKELCECFEEKHR